MEEQELLEAQGRLTKKREALGLTERNGQKEPFTELTRTFKDAPEINADAFDYSSDLVEVKEEAMAARRKVLRPDLPLCGVDKRLLGYAFENFTGCDKLVKDLRGMYSESIVLRGTTGCGKTHLAVSIMREENTISSMAYFITVPDLLLLIRGSFRDGSGGESEKDIVERFSRYDILVLDDLGAEKTSAFSVATLHIILDRRIRKEKRTIVTTNLSLDDIEKTLGARIASRLAEMRVITINMPDYRKKRGKNG
jgi:hypothetical protein